MRGGYDSRGTHLRVLTWLSLCLTIAFIMWVCPGTDAANDAQTVQQTAGTEFARLYGCEAGGICRERATNVPLRVLPKSFSRIYDSYEAQTIKYDQVPAFHPLYVFQFHNLDSKDAVESTGWYQIGTGTAGPPLGWMKAEDVLEWRQALIVSYTHPGTGEEARQKVVMFRSLEPLKKLAQSSNMERDAARLYSQLKEGDVPPQLVSKEPDTYVDIMEKFYLMPVVGFEKFDLNGEDARYLRIAAAVPGSRATDDVVKVPSKPKDPAKMVMDVVFVMDMTKSMQPYMDSTKEALVRLASQLDKRYAGELEGKVRFGLVGYRDDTRITPELEFTTYNFTPSLMSARELVEILANRARAAEVSSQGYSEEMFAGVNTALSETRWSEDSVKILIVVGDASSHPPGDPQNTTGLDAQALRGLARDRQIHIMAIHLKDGKFASDHAAAQQQFEALAQVAGSSNRAYVDLDVSEPNGFLSAVGRIAEKVGERLGELHEGAEPAKRQDAVTKNSASEKAGLAFDRVFDAALVEYLGRETEPHKDFIGWVLDRDLTDPAKVALAVRLLINRRQLNDLIVGLDTVIKSLEYTGTTQAKFLEALQELAAQAEKDPDRIAEAHRLADTGLLPAFIEALPYSSDILSLSLEQFAQMTAENRSVLEGRLGAKLQQYRYIHEDVTGWRKLNETDSQLEMVYPLSLDALP